jgi:hypothetical protein
MVNLYQLGERPKGKKKFIGLDIFIIMSPSHSLRDNILRKMLGVLPVGSPGVLPVLHKT